MTPLVITIALPARFFSFELSTHITCLVRPRSSNPFAIASLRSPRDGAPVAALCYCLRGLLRAYRTPSAPHACTAAQILRSPARTRICIATKHSTPVARALYLLRVSLPNAKSTCSVVFALPSSFACLPFASARAGPELGEQTRRESPTVDMRALQSAHAHTVTHSPATTRWAFDRQTPADR